MFLTIVVTALVLYVLYRFVWERLYPSPNINPAGKCVLISGCDSGFGRALAIELDQQGFRVFAGLYDPKNVEDFQETLSPRAVVFELDVTNREHIDAAFDLVKSKTPVLHALVNNAGIGAGGYIDWTSIDFMRRMMDVNFFGHVAMTKKFLPLLVAKRDSRVVNICSVAGYLTKPGMSAYSASKYALESFSDCLRREMAVWNLRVSIIEPGFMRTNIVQGHDKGLENLWNALTDDVKERWGEDILRSQVEEVRKNIFMRKAEDPVKVVRALKHAVMNSAPKIRYRPGWQSSCLMFPISCAPAWIADWLMTRPLFKGPLPTGVKKQLD